MSQVFRRFSQNPLGQGCWRVSNAGWFGLFAGCGMREGRLYLRCGELQLSCKVHSGRGGALTALATLAFLGWAYGSQLAVYSSTVRAQISATIQPITVHPSSTLTRMGPSTFFLCLASTMMVGRKYRARLTRPKGT